MQRLRLRWRKNDQKDAQKNQISLEFLFLLFQDKRAENNILRILIHKKTKANVITLYVNIRILTGEDNLYYSAATAVGNIIEQIKTLD